MQRRNRNDIALLSVLAALTGGISLAQSVGDESADPPPASESAAPAAAETDEDAELAAEDAAVDQVLSDAELIYEDDESDFTPSQQVSADQSLDYPIDI